jgi:isocitrate dehydrogenase kinase/phosphatase
MPAKIDALMRVKQVQERLAANPNDLNLFQRHSQEVLRDLHNLSSVTQRNFFKLHAILYNEEYTNGLRYADDMGPSEDTFPYREQDHPAVKLDGIWTTAQKHQFKPSST